MTSLDSRKILVVMSDLFFSVKINDAAKKLGMTIAVVKDPEAAAKQLQSAPAMVILDLNCVSVDPMAMIRTIKADPATAGIPTIGFVSHVQTETRQQAVDSGCDLVLARSAFAQNLEPILSGYFAKPV